MLIQKIKIINQIYPNSIGTFTKNIKGLDLDKSKYKLLFKPLLIPKINAMENLLIAAQIVLALSVVYVWIFRFDNIVVEFKQYGLPDVIRNMVGASKIALATLLIAGIWYTDLLLYSALSMAFLMICAQLAHFKVKNPVSKHLPSLLLLILSLFIAGVKADIIN